MRKLASVRRISEINPIEGADAIEVATVDGWKVVVKKNEFNVGDLAVYFEIDSWIPTEVAPFLTKPGKTPSVFNGVNGERLRTIKLRGQLSQGLLIGLDVAVEKFVNSDFDEGQELCEVFYEGANLTTVLGIQKWERPIPAQLAGKIRGNFPTEVPKTDQERVQNLVKEVTAAIETGLKFEITEKLEGSSCTFFLDREGVFHVCSRNLDLQPEEGNAFWQAAVKCNVEQHMRNQGLTNIAIQGELVGPGIQGNIYGLTEVEFYVFDIYNANSGMYFVPEGRQNLTKFLMLKHVPFVAYSAELYDTLGITSIAALLEFAEGKSRLADVEREGIVFKQVDGGITFKAISNRYLLGEK